MKSMREIEAEQNWLMKKLRKNVFILLNSGRLSSKANDSLKVYLQLSEYLYHYQNQAKVSESMKGWKRVRD